MSELVSRGGESSGRFQSMIPGAVPMDLPSMQSVRQAVAQASYIRAMKRLPKVLLKDADTGEELTDPVSDALVYNMLLSPLFQWSIFVHTDDVPNELLEECIWSLEMFIRVLEEGSEAQLHATGHIPRVMPGDRIAASKELMVSNARLKAALHLLKPCVNRPADAAKQMQYVIDDSRKRTGEDGKIDADVLLTYAEALVRSGTKLKEAERVLRSQLKTDDVTASGLYVVVRCKVWLARLLRKQDKVREAEEYEEWLIKWFRKNPFFVPDLGILELLTPGGDMSSPVLEALGGTAWLTGRRRTDRTDLRLAKQCHQCGGREPLVKLFMCSKCKKSYFCSTECQRKAWPFHKFGCLDVKDSVAMMTPKDARREKDYRAWLAITDNGPIISALGVHRDAARGRTHLVVKEVCYTPKASKEVRNKFRVLRCGVFRIADVIREIERVMCLKPGEGMETIDSVIHGTDRLPGQCFPVIIHIFGKGVEARLSGDAVLPGILKELPYNRDWRRELNPAAPPGMVTFLDGSIKDAEHDF